MNDAEIVERLGRHREMRAATVGGHAVFVDTAAFPAGELTTVHRVRDGRVTVVRAESGSYREDVARVLLDLPLGADGRIRAAPIDLPGLPFDRAIALTDLSAGEVPCTVVAAVHHSEIRAGEPERDFQAAISSHGTGLVHHIGNWRRTPVARADARLLDDWPGGIIRRSSTLHAWPAERLLTRVAPEGPAGVRVEIHAVGGEVLVLRREWDRGVGTLTLPDGTPTPVDLPRHELWARLGPVFLGDPAALVTEHSGTPETDVLDLRYQTEEHGWASLPMMETLDHCVARLDRHILRTPGNWAVFTSRSDAVIQVECTAEGLLWLETPYPEEKRSHGRVVTVEEAAALLTTLAREDRSAVDDLPGVEVIGWD
ncbi:hypothetical protein [Actinoplanes sp. NPDC051851]|uniref:hypothetical protein n=1 Tax=Actinoplanes sp. NPDC051851 TaxID=3154753 RepID=UPI00341BDC75